MKRRIATGNPTKMSMALMAVLWMAMPGRMMGRENPYDVLGKTLMPIASVFAVDGSNGRNGNDGAGRALVLDAHLLPGSAAEGSSGGRQVGEASLPIAAAEPQAAHLALMPPGQFLLQAPIGGQLLTVCRDGDTLWATPGSKIQPLLDLLPAAASGKKQKKRRAEGERILGPLALPVPQKDLVFLPVLFQVADAGDETLGANPCMVLDVQLMPQLAKSLHAEDWTARLWVTADYAIAQIKLTGPDWTGTVAIDKLAFPAALPDGTFQPQGTDVLRLTGEQFLGLMERVGR